ncbi:PepSY domain-containing protein [Sphingosinicella sp. LHD-64]|uniref:PepSY domain-containing protein n=1 Tax=Sphingosinicella sp. LHD-64 TaxID=3072139 RepID=UPI00280D5811|nr:PepSY domain-containing protein [Sphingosinicella sp. LHD-64]MDQ8757390.1 PepSY domain-containing protein [Sphingosinicella sp. LHD-64]
MKRIRLSPLLFRRIHKWVGLILGLQFVLWAFSGSMMALLDMDEVGGHDMAMAAAPPLPANAAFIDPAAIPGTGPVSGVTLRNLAGRPVYELHTARGLRLADATNGAPVTVDERIARAVANGMNGAPIRSVEALARPNLEAREHAGRMWRVNFADEANSSAYVSAETGRFLVMRGDTWRTWDFFWMLHNMDYVGRTSFNHPLIIFVGLSALWLSGTGFYLLFKSFGRADFRWLRRRRPAPKKGPALAP